MLRWLLASEARLVLPGGGAVVVGVVGNGCKVVTVLAGLGDPLDGELVWDDVVTIETKEQSVTER